jgi:hypothetical protein
MNFDSSIADGYVMDPDIADMDKKLKAEGKTGIVYDPSAQADPNADPIANLPNTEDILTGIELILQKMCEDEMVKLKENDPSEFSNYMESQFPAFSFRYYSLFQTIIEGKDLTPLFGMLGSIEQIKSGAMTLDQAEKEQGEELAQEFVYPHVGQNTEGKKKKKHKK